MFILDFNLENYLQELNNAFGANTTNSKTTSTPKPVTKKNPFSFSFDKFLPATNTTMTPTGINPYTREVLGKSIQQAGLSREAILNPQAVTDKGKRLEDYTSQKTDDGEDKYELVGMFDLRLEHTHKHTHSKLPVHYNREIEFYQEMLEKLQESEGLQRVWNVMSFANVIPKSVLIALGGLASSHENALVRSLAGSLMPTVAGIARKYAMLLAKMGNLQYAKELLQAISSLNLASCSNRDCDKSEGPDGHVYAGVSSADKISPNGYQQDPTGTLHGDISRIAIVDKQTGEVVDYVDGASFGHSYTKCDEDCDAAQIVNDSITKSEQEAEATLMSAKQEVDRFESKKEAFGDAMSEKSVVREKLAKARERKDLSEVSRLEQRESELNQVLFYNA